MKISPPNHGTPITQKDGKLVVSDTPIVCAIEGDGIGADIWPVAKQVLDATVEKTYSNKRQLAWLEVFAGEKATQIYGENQWLPEETLEAFRTYKVGLKGPLTTPIGGGFRSLNVALRQELDLFACVRPVHYFDGVPSPVKAPEAVNMTIFRENTEDIYAGIEFAHGTHERDKLRDFLMNNLGVTSIRFPETSGLGVKPISKEGTERIMRAAMDYAIAHNKPSVTVVHKGNIMKYTEGAFKEWAYDLVRRNYSDVAAIAEDVNWEAPAGKILVKSVIADNFLQQALLRPEEYDVVCTMNLNGDYISDHLAAMVGGIGISPGANINYDTGTAIFEATHGTAPKYAGKNSVNPSSVILSGAMMLDYLGWHEAAEAVRAALGKAIANRTVTFDFAREMPDATEVSCSGFGEAIIRHL